jgi:glycosylphosphatidylinositol transamidase (GPIT) subunit GPI8
MHGQFGLQPTHNSRQTLIYSLLAADKISSPRPSIAKKGTYETANKVLILTVGRFKVNYNHQINLLFFYLFDKTLRRRQFKGVILIIVADLNEYELQEAGSPF